MTNLLVKFKFPSGKRAILLPVLFCMVYLLLVTVFLGQIGNRWNGFNTDPDYIHLFETLNVINGYTPGNIDNPATTLHFFSAVLFKIAYFFRSLGGNQLSITNDVLSNPNDYISFCSLFYISIICICIYRYAHTVLSQGITSEGLLITGSLFLMTPLFTNPTEFSAQPILIIVGLILLTTIYKIWVFNTPPTNLQTAVIGFSLALGLFSKFTILHLFPIVFFLGFSKRQYLLLLGCFLALSFPFIMRLYGEEHRILQWLQGNITRTGVYGSSPEFWPDPKLFYSNILFFIKGNIVFSLSLCLVILRFSFNLKLIKSQRLVLVLLLLQVIFIAFMAKHRTSSYYFIVDFILLPIYVKFLMDEYLSKTMRCKEAFRLNYLLAGAISLFFITLVYFRFNRFNQNISQNIQLFENIEKSGVLNGTESGSIISASFYGNWNSGFKYSKELVKIFGNQNFPSINSDSLMQFDGKKVGKILAGEKILIHDYDFNRHIDSSYYTEKQLTNYLIITKK
jgi:hypothetical protein